MGGDDDRTQFSVHTSFEQIRSLSVVVVVFFLKKKNLRRSKKKNWKLFDTQRVGSKN